MTGKFGLNGEDPGDEAGATRYARPWRPVKPREMIWLVWQRCVRQREQRRMEAWLERKVGEGGVAGEHDDSGDADEDDRVVITASLRVAEGVDGEAALAPLLFVVAGLERRRNGMLGRR